MPKKRTLPCGPACSPGRISVAIRSYSNGSPSIAAVICGAPGHEAVDALVAAGATFVPRIHDVPRAAMCGWLARRRMDAGESHDPATLTPLYVHPSEAEVRFGRTVARAGGPDSADDQ